MNPNTSGTAQRQQATDEKFHRKIFLSKVVDELNRENANNYESLTLLISFHVDGVRVL